MDPPYSSASIQFMQSRADQAASRQRPGPATGWSPGHLRRRVSHAVDSGGWGTLLVLSDVILSVLSVLLYIVATYIPQNAPLAYIQLALAGYFFANWVFWLWIDQDRPSYVVSWGTLVDALTILPEVVLFALAEAESVAATADTLPTLNVLRVLRILRVLRVLRMKQVVQRHINSAVTEAAVKLGFTLLCILLIAAGLFYELQKYGPPRDSKLTFHEAVYWAAVTITTVGYGDIAPTWWATQVMLIALLVLTFTVLPYLTSELMSALTSTSKYQRNRYKPPRKAGAQHVVIMGTFDADALGGLLDELYHTDKGYSLQDTAVLCDKHPSADIKRVLYTHTAAKSVTYLHGSPFRVQDLDRAAAVFANAVLIIAPKYPPDSAAADMQLAMMTLSLGRYLQDAHASLRKQLGDSFVHAPHRLWHWIRHSKVTPPARLPTIYQQVCLPAGRKGLQRVLAGFQHASSSGRQRNSDLGLQVASPYTPNHAQGSLHQGTVQQRPRQHEGMSRPLKANDASINSSSGSSSSSSRDQYFGSAAGGSHPVKQESQPMPRAAGAGCSFWEEFSGSIHLLCLSEIKYAMMAQSVVGVPGVMTLLCNLSTTIDFGRDTLRGQHFEVTADVPDWLQDYMSGASQELYQLAAFPACLVGCSVREAAGFLFDVVHAVLLAVERAGGPDRHMLSVGDLAQVITADMHGYVIAENSSILQAILAVQPSDFLHWLRHAQLQQYHKALGTGPNHSWKLPVPVAGPVNGGGHAAAADGRPAQCQKHPVRPMTRHRRDRAAFYVQSPLAALLHRLRSPSSVLQQEGQAVLQGHYHTRPPGAVQSSQDLLVDRIDLRGHILVLGVPHGKEGLIALLAALRSRQLQGWRPVVIVDKQGPGLGGSWNVVAQLRDVYCIKIHHDLNDALLRASSEHAVQAVLTAPLTLLDDADDDPLTASVTTDARVISTYHLLKTLNPDMQVLSELMLPYNMAYLLPAPTSLLGDPHSSQAHLLTPAWMTGSVFHARVLDDMLVANYCNSNATTSIILELLLSWHTSWSHTLQQPQLAKDAGDTPSPTAPAGQHKSWAHTLLQPDQGSFNAAGSWPGTLGDNSSRLSKTAGDAEQGEDQHRAAGDWGGRDAGLTCSFQVQQQELHQRQQQELPRPQQHKWPQQPPLPPPPQQDKWAQPLPLQHPQQVQQVSDEAAAAPQQHLAGCAAAQAESAAAATADGRVDIDGGADNVCDGQIRGGPHSAATLLQILVKCPPGTTYGRYFHLLLHTRGLLLLGVYRSVGQPGQAYRVVITNARQDCLMQPDDHAFVVARLPLPADCSDSAAVAAAWPRDTLGFGHIHPATPQQRDLLVLPCSGSTEQQHIRSTLKQGPGEAGSGRSRE